MKYIVISRSILSSENVFLIRKCSSFKIGRTYQFQSFSDIEYLRSGDGKFVEWSEAYENEIKYKTAKDAVKCLRKHYPKKKFFLIRFDHE